MYINMPWLWYLFFHNLQTLPIASEVATNLLLFFFNPRHHMNMYVFFSSTLENPCMMFVCELQD